MCDEITERENDQYLQHKGISRRDLGKLGAGAALMAMLPPVANAQDTVDQQVVIETADGPIDAYFVHPASGQHAAVIMWPDIGGQRPAFHQMAKRLAQSGYAVLAPNPFFRNATVADIQAGNIEGTTRDFRAQRPAGSAVSDSRALLAWLDQQPAVDTQRKVGISGYCMSGPWTIEVAAAEPARIGAGASFHGAGLASDSPDSPHHLVAKTDAGFLIAIASNDDERDPQAKELLRAAFENSPAYAEIEVYPDAMHGWCPPDSRVYNEAMAERAWSRMLSLFAWRLA